MIWLNFVRFKKQVLLFVIAISIFSTNSQVFALEAMFAGKSALNGFIKDSHTKETIIGATVYLKDSKYGTKSNKSGFYSITNIEPGEYILVVSSIGYEKFEKKFKLKADESFRENFELKQSSVLSEGVSVIADKEVEKRQISISKVNIPVEQIKEIRIGGESDVFRSLQMLPGILTSSQISSGLYVRGGSPDQNLVLVDNSTVYNPTHLFGFLSTFNSDAIKDVEIIKGAYPAEYGGRLSSVLTITQKDGNQEEFGGIASLGMISSRLGIEGPIGNGSFFLGGRRTYFDLITSMLPEDPKSPFPDFNFYDLNAKVSQDLSDDDKLFLSGFASADALQYGSNGIDFNLDIGNRLVSARWNHILSDDLFSWINISGSNYYNTFKIDQSGYKILIDNGITDYSIKAGLEWFTNEKLTHKFGIESNKLEFTYLQNFTGETDSTKPGSDGGELNIKVNDWNHSIYTQINYMLDDNYSIQTGLRGNLATLSNIFTVDPRIALRYQYGTDFSVKFAYGLYHQYLRLASQPDFSFFDTWLPTDTTINVSSSNHYVLSFETTPTDGFDLNFDLYYKTMHNINEINMNNLEGTTVGDVFYTGDATAYGAELFLQKKFGKLTGWIGYGLGFVNATFDSINNGTEFRPKYDRTHDLKIVMQYKFSDSWEFGANFTYQSGQSYTGATSRIQSRLPGQNYGAGKVFPSQRYGLRLPSSHQLNVNVSYIHTLFGTPARLILDVYNVYNKRDIWFRYYNTQKNETTVEDVLLLPIIPSISYEIKF